MSTLEEQNARLRNMVDALEHENAQLRRLCQDMLPVFEAARPLVLNLERLRDAAVGGK